MAQSLEDRADDVLRRFQCFPEVNDAYRHLVDATSQLAQAVLMVTPINRDQSIALTHLEDAMLRAAKSILAGSE